MMDAEQINRLFELFEAVREGTVTEEQLCELDQILSRDKTACKYYFEYFNMCVHLRSGKAFDQTLATIPEMNDSLRDMGFWQAMAREEKTAPEMEIPVVPKEPEKEERPTAIKKFHPRVSKYSVISLVLSSAALIFVIVYAHFVSMEQGIEVATLSDSIQAKWSYPNSLVRGTRLSAGGDPIQITKGIIKLWTDNGAQLLLEGPAEFRFINSDELSMNYGRIFVNVSQAANGFTVQTKTSKVIDLGTQFGVYTDIRGETELHVYEGKTVLIAGLRNQVEKVLNVTAGQACEFSGSGDDVKSIQLSQDTFAKSIDSQMNLVWRGQKEISLADIVGGGSGLGTGSINTGISPTNGYTEKPEYITRRHRNTYIPVGSNVFIDGVFVPNGYTEQIVTTENHPFKDCPITSGHFYADITNTPSMIRSAGNADEFPLLLGEINYSMGTQSCIFLHANLGITFDLNAFRSRLPGAEIRQFCSDAGISDSLPKFYTAAFWVLVDGQVRYHKDIRTQGLADQITIKIKKTDRFLTLVTTDGTAFDPESADHSIGYDWCIFGNPVLVLE